MARPVAVATGKLKIMGKRVRKKRRERARSLLKLRRLPPPLPQEVSMSLANISYLTKILYSISMFEFLWILSFLMFHYLFLWSYSSPFITSPMYFLQYNWSLFVIKENYVQIFFQEKKSVILFFIINFIEIIILVSFKVTLNCLIYISNI